ncbi:ABC transporter ATP-binding protein [Paenibacillus sp. D2_2]|uniref:ABC transporter ATP-binding protein n=1 Tax=Paenibacillus sp. D2_2 TaxID=3073092 RepID=UPI002815C4D5|nr:ABC transporter ATP-binding protein [Paenibacillus sp. D2_2]WMT43260.1 ABC transporter ATP-binding protein [Paenibacillus sp. D2_2]
MKLIFSFIRRHLGMFLTAMFFLCVETLADLLQPTFMAYIVDNGVKGQDVQVILYYGAIMVGIAALGALGAVMRNIYASRTSQTISKELRGELYRKVQTLSFENIDRLQPSSIITRITNDVTQIQNFINSSMRIMIKAPITCIGAVILIMVQTPQQIPVMVAILVIAGALIVGNMKLGYPRFGKLQQKLDKLNGVSREFFSSIRVVKAFGAEAQEQEKFGAAAGEFADAGISATRVLAVFSPLINLTVNMGIIALLWLSGSQNTGQIGRLMASVNYMTQVLFAIGMVSMILNTAVRALASSERVQEILDEQPAQLQPQQPRVFDVKGEVSFNNVSFTYARTGRAAIEGIDFTANAGETIGIIGPTGSGKTTLVNLVPRFYDATQGQVLIDGCDVTQMDTELLRNAIAVVPQKALLFTGTIADNLRFGNSAATDEELRQAARIASADDFVSDFTDGYETRLGQGGVNLSGGQKQRISIARALLRRPRILILDDCTSALDASTEAAVLNGLRTEAAGITVLLISQRISTVMRTDRILCMEDGQLRGFGTHQELMENCMAYRAIYASQIGGDHLE